MMLMSSQSTVRELLTVIVPVYNTGNYLQKCIKSIISQTYSHLEILIIDDGSDAETIKICEEVSVIDQRIKLYHKDNGGLGTARNYGIDRASGEYLTFVDSDDYIEDPETYEYCVEALDRTNADAVQYPLQRIHEYGREPIESISQEKTYCGTKEIFLNYKACYDNEGGGEITTSACDKVYRRSSIGDFRFRQMFVEDSYFNTYILQHIDKLTQINKGLYAYCMRDGSLIRSAFSLNKQMDLNLCRKCAYEGFIKYTDDYTNQGILLLKLINGLALSIARSADVKKSIKDEYSLLMPRLIKGKVSNQIQLYIASLIGITNYAIMQSVVAKLIGKAK